MASSDSSLSERVQNDLRLLARDVGVTPDKVGASLLFDLAEPPADWRRPDVTHALMRVLASAASQIDDPRKRAAVSASLNLEQSSGELGLLARQKALATKIGRDPDTVRNWWRDEGVTRLASEVIAIIERLNSHPSAWYEYLPLSQWRNDSGTSSAKYAFETVENSWRLNGRVAIELYTQRVIVSQVDGLDHVRAVGWYFADRSADACTVVPLMNCEAREQRHAGRGIVFTELYFPRPLKIGEGAFFSYKVLINSQEEMEPLFYHNVTSAGVKRLICRVQFDRAEIPSEIWRFSRREETELLVPPVAGSDDYILANELGFADHAFDNCRPGFKIGISWRWKDNGTLP